MSTFIYQPPINTNTMKSSIFLNNITVIDHAYINDIGNVIGGSYNASFLVSGEVISNENVVVDFSTIKRDIKILIDRHSFDLNVNGFDHKLWIIDGYSNINQLHEYSQNNDNYIQIETDCVTLDMPLNSIKRFNSDNYGSSELEVVLSKFITEQLNKQPCYKLINLDVKCYLNETANHPISDISNIAYFRYVHGLRYSTSYGCRNLSHGHLSYIITDDKNISSKIASDLNNTIFINIDNVVEKSNTHVKIKYVLDFNEDDRVFSAIYNLQNNKIVILNTETTIEFLGKYIKETYQIKSPIFVSEGLSKGSYE